MKSNGSKRLLIAAISIGVMKINKREIELIST
jgi:hypothetical protein